MTDASAARAGALFAAIALVMAVVPWDVEPVVAVSFAGDTRPLLIVLAGVAVIAFTLRRFDRLGRTASSAVAGVASTGVAVYALAILVAPPGGGSGSFAIEPLVVLTAGSLAVVAAYANYRAVPAAELLTNGRVVLTGSAVGAMGLFVGLIVTAIPAVLVGQVVGNVRFEVQFVLMIATFGLGLIATAVAFLWFTRRGLSYLDVRVPSLRDVGYAGGGVFALLGVALVIAVVYAQFNVPTTENSIERTAREEGAVLLLWALPLAWLAIGLGEELLFRNVIQKYFAEYLSIAAAIVVSSVIFTLVHIPAYYNPEPLAMASTLAVVFSLSLILGATYARTENLVVPVFIHGTYNAVIFLSMYVAMTGGG